MMIKGNRKNPGITGLVCAWMFVVGGVMAESPDWSSKPASPATIKAQQEFRKTMPEDNGQDMAFARRGFIADLENPVIRAENGRLVMDTAVLDWVQGDAPDTVNPSLWRLNKIHLNRGLFKLAEGVYQIRNITGPNTTFVEGETGWIVIDPGIGIETVATVKRELVDRYLGERPVMAVMYTHTHFDHHGGVRALISEDDNVPIIAPEHFMEESISELLMAGNAMTRRSTLHTGNILPAGPRGYAGIALNTIADKGTITLIPPTDEITHTGETRVIDGVRFEFQMVPESEAPTEMNVFMPDRKTLYISEMTTCTMHNFQTPRGALVRDPLKWQGYITEAIDLYGDRIDTLGTGHCWPRFGQDNIIRYLNLQRDNYKFIHDQTVRLMNRGETPFEIADQIKRPTAITDEWSNRDYYATVQHNAKGVYQRYIGWWSGIPAHLNMHPPVEQGRRYVRSMGGAGKVIGTAEKAMKEGDYRWAAEILNHVVFVDPSNDLARSLLADSYEQMGYQTESTVWRNIYLVGAAELRGAKPPPYWLAVPDLIRTMPYDSMMDMVATLLNPQAIGEATDLSLNIRLTDEDLSALVTVRNAVLVNRTGRSDEHAGAGLRGTKHMFAELFLFKKPLQQLIEDGLEVSGDRAAVEHLLRAIELPASDYPVVTP